MKKFGAVGVALAAGLFLSAPASADEPLKGGTLTSVESHWWPTWQPHVIGGYEWGNVYGAIADSLLYHDAKKGLVPWLAESYEASPNQTEFTFKLRPGVTFSDGAPLDANAVKANFDDLGLGDQSKGVLRSAYFKGYLGTDVVDSLTVRVKFGETNSRFLAVVSTHFAAIVAPSTLQLNVQQRSQLKNVIGSGAFVIESVKTNEEIVLTRRKGYAWPPATSPNKGEAYLDRIVVKFSSDASVRTSALLSRQADLVRSVLPSDEARLKSAGITIRSVSGSKTLFPWTLHFRPAVSVLRDVKVRHAIAIGLDRKVIAKAILSDSYVVADSILGHGHRAFVDQSAALAYDPVKAGKLLDEAGWKLNAKGIREKEGVELRLNLAANTQNSFAKEYTDAIVQQLAKIGVIVNNRAGDNAYAAQLFDPRASSDAGLFPLQGWIHNGFDGNLDVGRYSGVANPAFAQLVREERVTTDPAKQIDLLRRQQLFFVSENWLAVPLLDEGQVYGVAPTVHGLTFDAEVAPLFQAVWVRRR